MNSWGEVIRYLEAKGYGGDTFEGDGFDLCDGDTRIEVRRHFAEDYARGIYDEDCHEHAATLDRILPLATFAEDLAQFKAFVRAVRDLKDVYYPEDID